jgi:uncharacterized membrane protein
LAVVIVGGWYRRRGAEGGAETTLSDTPEPETGVNAVAESKTPPEELLSDEERLLQLLEDHGGRMKQQDAVEELEWSETKTSQVVTDLYEAEKIERYRLGRENVLALPGEMDV